MSERVVVTRREWQGRGIIFNGDNSEEIIKYLRGWGYSSWEYDDDNKGVVVKEDDSEHGHNKMSPGDCVVCEGTACDPFPFRIIRKDELSKKYYVRVVK